MELSKTVSTYQKLKAAGCQMDNHESDLYIEATEKALELTEHEPNRSFFTHQVTKQRWIELPFMFEPWWEKRTKGK